MEEKEENRFFTWSDQQLRWGGAGGGRGPGCKQQGDGSYPGQGGMGETIWSSVCKTSHRAAVSHARLPMVMGRGKKEKNKTKKPQQQKTTGGKKKKAKFKCHHLQRAAPASWVLVPLHFHRRCGRFKIFRHGHFSEAIWDFCVYAKSACHPEEKVKKKKTPQNLQKKLLQQHGWGDISFSSPSFSATQPTLGVLSDASRSLR